MITEQLLHRIRKINSDITIRSAEKTDAAAFINLMNSQYQRKKTEAYFHWQFMTSAVPVRLFVAYKGSELIACYGVQILRLTNGAYCGFAVDLLIAPVFRNRGLFALLEYEVSRFAATHECVALICLPNPDGMKAHKGLGTWQQVGIVQTLGLSLLADSAMSAHEGFCENEITVAFEKDARYQAWRFFQHPEYRYSLVNLNPDVFLITKIFTDPVTGSRYGDIVDFHCATDNPELLLELFGNAIVQLNKESIESITTWALAHTPLYNVLLTLGFKNLLQERFFCIKVLNSAFEYLYDYTKWHLVQADSEIY